MFYKTSIYVTYKTLNGKTAASTEFSRKVSRSKSEGMNSSMGSAHLYSHTLGSRAISKSDKGLSIMLN